MSAFDVVVIGEPLIEIATVDPIAPRARATLDVSGDIVNAAAAAVAAGARVAAIARVSTDELGDAVCARFDELGVDTRYVQRINGFQGIYVQHADPDGARQFCYARTGSVGSTLCVDDLPDEVCETAGAVLASGITAALSPSARATLVEAARRSPRFVYDPNFRPRLTDVATARAVLDEVAAHASVMTPSAPGEIETLLHVDTPAAAAAALRSRGVPTVAVTCGADGVHVEDAEHTFWQPVIPAPSVLDQTGAGDVFVGTLAARLALGDDVADAVPLAAAASSLAVGGAGGSGGIEPLARVRAHLTSASASSGR